ncbi:MAG: hypothetical protein NTZ58_02490 [Solirubrobacterales bacterium]|nr:hypothetical protein [Solirubrobacterales bacterium]
MSIANSPALDARARSRRRSGIAAICVLALGWAFVMQSLGWAQTSYFAFVKALGDGTAQIDKYHWETRDKSWINGHFFSVKAPGLPLVAAPAYLLLKAAGAEQLSASAADRARRGGAKLWTYKALNVSAYGYDSARARAVTRQLEVQAPLVWSIGLLVSVLPALGLLLLIRKVAERLRPGYGTVSALTLGMATMVLVFASQFFGHMLASLVIFAAFALLMRERRGPPRLALVGLAGVLAGLAVTVEYPIALAGAAIGVYAMLRGDLPSAGLWPKLARGAAYAAGVVIGVAPILAYNQWAFGSPSTNSYSNAVDVQGFSGHATLGLNSGGFFGIGVPDPQAALELLLAPRGIITITPVVIAGLYGVWLMRSNGKRAEANLIIAIVALFFIYDTGYWLPFGGGTPGPRFLIPTLPFIALGFAEAWRRIPATTLVLSACGFVVMATALLTYPLVGAGNLFQWQERALDNTFQHTILTVFGLGDGWPTIIPVLALFAAAIWLGARATGALAVRADTRRALWALGAWALLALALSRLLGERAAYGNNPDASNHGGLPASVVVIALAVALVGLLLARRAERLSADRGQPQDQQGAAALAADA